ncbi:MAG: cytochrome c [Anaerolineae bacterium]|nr:cytochrome c [Anaerolineae bacterium]
MFKPERLLLLAILVAALAACGTPATPAPTLASTLVLPTRVPVQPSTAAASDVTQPPAVAVQPTTAPTVPPTIVPTQAAANPTAIPATQVLPSATVGVPATATVARTAPATAAAGGSSGGAAPAGNPGRGQQVFNGIGTCSTCHNVANETTLVGPGLKGMATRAGTRKPGMSASDYLHESIVSPNAFVVSGFQPGIMPQNFKQLLSTQQIDDLVAYLLTLK